MLQPIKKLYFWIKSKVKKMNNEERFKNQNDRKKLLIDNLSDYCQKEGIIGYIEIESIKHEGIDFRVGMERFTIFWIFSKTDSSIYLKTYYWKLDPSVFSNYNKTRVYELDTLQMSENAIQFIKAKMKDKEAVCNSTEFPYMYFTEIEKYLKDSIKNDIISI